MGEFWPRVEPMRNTNLQIMIRSTSILLAFALASQMLLGQAEVVATGLLAPHKLILTPRGNFLVTETNLMPNLGRISFVSRSGTRRSLVEGLPSGTEVVGGGSGPSAMILKDRTLYVSIGAGDIERRNATGASIHNPAGISSPLYLSILEFRFSLDLDQMGGTFKMSPAQQQTLADGDEVEMDDSSGAKATVRVLVRFPHSTPEGSGYRFSNPWGLALSADGLTLWVVDASQNTLNRVDLATGRWVRVMRFAPIPNPTPVGPPVFDSVPTGIRIYGQQLLISFLSGFPFPRGSARVLAVNPESKTVEPFIFGLTSATDVLWRDRGPNLRPQFWVLEFSLNQSATTAPPGRLLRFDAPEPVVVLSDLRAPVSLAFDSTSEELFILELSGRILKVSAR